MTITHDELQQRLDNEIGGYQMRLQRIVMLSLADIYVLTVASFPGAAFLPVDVTDQDFSGSLVVDGDGPLDADGIELEESDDVDSWADAVWGPLSNLDDTTKNTWLPFSVYDDEARKTRLNLTAIGEALDMLTNWSDDA